jgi:hypothetical protein
MLRYGVAAALCVALAGCGTTQAITQTAFERQAGDGASVFSAAAETLRFVHVDPAKFTVEYGAGSMINYDDQVSSLPDDLASADGAPDQATTAHLVEVVMPAVNAVANPCLLPDCDWQSQVAALDAAKDALLAAIGE